MLEQMEKENKKNYAKNFQSIFSVVAVSVSSL